MGPEERPAEMVLKIQPLVPADARAETVMTGALHLTRHRPAGLSLKAKERHGERIARPSPAQAL